MSTGGQHVNFVDTVWAATDADVRRLLAPSVASLLNKLGSEALTGDTLRQVVTGSRTPYEYLSDPGARLALVDMLTVSQSKVLAARLNLDASADPFTTLKSASVQLDSGQLDTVLDFFGAQKTPPPASMSGSASTATANYRLFPHQRNALRRTRAQLLDTPRRVILHMPTGAGKTRTAMNLAAEHLRENDPSVMVWLAYSRELLEQAASEFETAWSYLGNRDVDLVRYWGNADSDLTQITDGVVIAGLDKIYSLSQRSANDVFTLGDRTSLVVFDEAHQSIAKTFASVTEKLANKNPTTGLLGLTATPGRTWADMDKDAELSNFWGKKKVMLEIEGHTNPIDYLIEAGYLARPVFRTVNADAGVTPSTDDLANLGERLDISDELLDRLAEDELWNAQVIATTEELLTRHRRVIVFATNVAQAETLAAVMRARGSAAATVTGTTPSHLRTSVLQRYQSNSEQPMAIFNYGVLTTGFDAPSTSAAVIARPTMSLVLYSQMIGRALRGPKAGGNVEAEIVTVTSPELPGFGNPAEAFTNWEDVW